MNIATKLNWKLFTIVIKRPRKGSLGLDRQSVLIKREAQGCLKSESASALIWG
jgi:hypothetical protein